MTKINTNAFQTDFIGWKAYKNIAKKAMDKEFSWSGLMVSLSIAFLIVIISSYLMSNVYQSIEISRRIERESAQQIYYLEQIHFTNFTDSSRFETSYNQII